MTNPARLALAIAIACLALPVLAADPATSTNGPKGPMLTDAQGMTLYTFDKDAGGKSTCSGACAVNWPPFTAAADAKQGGNYTVIARDDGSKQWAYSGKPLYRWAKDAKAGDTSGDGMGGAWHIARP